MSKADLYPLVADLMHHGCNSEEIAAYVEVSGQRIRQVLADMGITKRRYRTLEDLPHDLRQRVIAYRNLRIANDIQNVSRETN